MVPLPSTAAYVPPDNVRHPDYVPTPPTTQALPKQEPGVRPARAVPYEFARSRRGQLLGWHRRAFTFATRARRPRCFRCAPATAKTGRGRTPSGRKRSVSDTWAFGRSAPAAYDLSVYGPNGFFRAFKGRVNGEDLTHLVVSAVTRPRAGYHARYFQSRQRGQQAAHLRCIRQTDDLPFRGAQPEPDLALAAGELLRLV